MKEDIIRTECSISFDAFNRFMNSIVRVYQFQNDLSQAASKFSAGREEANLKFPSLIEDAIDLLKILTNDTLEWIDYWVFELGCGEKYKDGCAIQNNKKIKLKTIEDLWNAINN